MQREVRIGGSDSVTPPTLRLGKKTAAGFTCVTDSEAICVLCLNNNQQQELCDIMKACFKNSLKC